MPPAGAGFSSVAVPVTDVPPITASLLSDSPHRIGNMPIELCCQPRPYAARIVPTVAPWTGSVVIGDTIASVAPAGMSTLAGVCACGRSLAIEISAPPAGAGWFSVTRACVLLPPYVVPGSTISVNSASPGGVGGDAATLNVAPADQGPNASPCSARTRQKYWPGGKWLRPSSSGSFTTM